MRKKIITPVLVLMMLIAVFSVTLHANNENNQNLPDDEDITGDDENQMSEEWDVYYVDSGDDLPACDTPIFGRLYYVASTSGFEVCTSSGWTFINLIGAPGNDGVNGTKGTDGTDGVDGADGTDGENGTVGAPGIDGESIISVRIPEQEGENCPYSGTKIQIGIDDDGDRQIDTDKVILTHYECNQRIVYLYNYESSEYIIVMYNGNQLLDGDVTINGYDIRATTIQDDSFSINGISYFGSDPAASAIAKAAAINDASQYTGVYATVEPTIVTATADIAAVDFDSTNNIVINGYVISGFDISSNDAFSTSNSNVRLAQYTSTSDIQVSYSDALLDQDVMIVSGANGVWTDKIDIRATINSDDTVSTSYNSASAIAKAAAINDASQYTGVYAIVEPTIVTATADIAAVDFDSVNNIAINGQTISGISIESNDATGTLVNAINSETNTTGVSATLNHNNRLVLTASDGRNIEVTIAGSGTLVGLGSSSGTTVTGGKLILSSDSPFTLTGNAIDKLGHIGSEGMTEFGR